MKKERRSDRNTWEKALEDGAGTPESWRIKKQKGLNRKEDKTN